MILILVPPQAPHWLRRNVEHYLDDVYVLSMAESRYGLRYGTILNLIPLGVRGTWSGYTDWFNRGPLLGLEPGGQVIDPMEQAHGT